jgi:hypothetical protein
MTEARAVTAAAPLAAAAALASGAVDDEASTGAIVGYATAGGGRSSETQLQGA